MYRSMLTSKFASVGGEISHLPPLTRRRWHPQASLLVPPPKPPATTSHPVESGQPKGRALAALSLRAPVGRPSPRPAPRSLRTAWPPARLLPEPRPHKPIQAGSRERPAWPLFLCATACFLHTEL